MQSEILYRNTVTTITQSSLVPLHIQSLVQQVHWKAKCHPASSLQYQNNSNCLFQESNFSENNNSNEYYCHTDITCSTEF